MTSIGKHTESIIEQAKIVKELLEQVDETEFPPCCLEHIGTLHWKCGMQGPLPQEEFMVECRKCRKKAELVAEAILKVVKGLEPNGST